MKWHFNTKFIGSRFTDTASIDLRFIRYPSNEAIEVCYFAFELYQNVLQAMGLRNDQLQHLDDIAKKPYSFEDDTLKIYINGESRNLAYIIVFFNLLDRLCKDINEVICPKVVPRHKEFAMLVYPDIESLLSYPYECSITDRNVNFYVSFGNVAEENEKQTINYYLKAILIAGTLGGFRDYQQITEHSSMILPDYLEWSPAELYFEIQKTSVSDAFFDSMLLVLEQINKKVIPVINVVID